MDDITIKAVGDYTQEAPYQDLSQGAAARQEFIDRIKREVGEEWDNINNPIQFIPTPNIPVYEMV